MNPNTAPPVLVIGSGSPEAVPAAVRELSAGGVIALPTDTVYGLAVAGGDALAAGRLRRLKGRGAGKPFQVLIADYADAERFGIRPSALAGEIMRSCWPGPLTLVLPVSGGGTIGLRLPACELVRDIVRALGRPLLATSANLAGQMPARGAEEIIAAFGPELALVLAAREAPAGVSSTVARVHGERIEILRAGPLAGELEARYPESCCRVPDAACPDMRGEAE